MSTEGLKLQEGLAPIRVASLDGKVELELPCVFRRSGLALAEHDEAAAYTVTHEASGRRLGKPHQNPTHALAVVAALLRTGLDWEVPEAEVYAQVGLASETVRSLLVAIHHGNIVFQEMGRA